MSNYKECDKEIKKSTSDFTDVFCTLGCQNKFIKKNYNINYKDGHYIKDGVKVILSQVTTFLQDINKPIRKVQVEEVDGSDPEDLRKTVLG